MTRLSQSFPTDFCRQSNRDIFTIADGIGEGDMSKVGWILLAIAFATALLTKVLQPENFWLLAIFGASFILGSSLLLANAATQLFRGRVRLRPWDALKKAIVLFLIVLSLRLLLAWFIFPSSDRALMEDILGSALFAIGYSLYTTAYRKPE